jgi:hypothetical protein
MATIDHTNYSTTLKQSTNARGSSPNGNIYFDSANNEIQLIGVDELATVNFGAGAVTNPLNNADGITMRALYNFENSRRRQDETLRKYKRGTDGDYRFSGAFNFVNGVKLDSNDRNKIRGSGFIEYAAAGDGQTSKDRIYHGVKSLNSIQSGTTSYWALVANTQEATLQSATWTSFIRTGAIDEVVQVFGSTANGDSGAGNFDYTARILVVRTRSWGYNPGETTSVLTGISEFSGFSAGYGIGETLNADNSYTRADVYGGARISPWTGMSLEKLASPVTVTGFTETDGDFTWRLNNTAGGTVNECAAFLDAAILQDADIDSAAGTTYNGKKGRVWYTRNTAGKVVTSSNEGAGLYIDGLSTAEKQFIIQTDNAGDAKTYPFFPEIQATVGSAAVADTNAWYHFFYADGASTADFDTTGAVTVNDANGDPVKGNVATDAVANKISFAYAYDTDTDAGLTAGADKDMVMLVEGDGGVAQAITYFRVTKTAIIAISCIPPNETNS